MAPKRGRMVIPDRKRGWNPENGPFDRCAVYSYSSLSVRITLSIGDSLWLLLVSILDLIELDCSSRMFSEMKWMAEVESFYLLFYALRAINVTKVQHFITANISGRTDTKLLKGLRRGSAHAQNEFPAWRKYGIVFWRGHVFSVLIQCFSILKVQFTHSKFWCIFIPLTEYLRRQTNS